MRGFFAFQGLPESSGRGGAPLPPLLFLYKEVLDKQIGFVDGVVRAKRPHRCRRADAPGS
jgi:hypothetical protein